MSGITMMVTAPKSIAGNDTGDSKNANDMLPFLLSIALIVIGGMIVGNAKDCGFTNWFLYVLVSVSVSVDIVCWYVL